MWNTTYVIVKNIFLTQIGDVVQTKYEDDWLNKKIKSFIHSSILSVVLTFKKFSENNIKTLHT